jgi:hypothetical protein
MADNDLVPGRQSDQKEKIRVKTSKRKYERLAKEKIYMCKRN